MRVLTVVVAVFGVLGGWGSWVTRRSLYQHIYFIFIFYNFESLLDLCSAKCECVGLFILHYLAM